MYLELQSDSLHNGIAMCVPGFPSSMPPIQCFSTLYIPWHTSVRSMWRAKLKYHCELGWVGMRCRWENSRSLDYLIEKKEIKWRCQSPWQFTQRNIHVCVYVFLSVFMSGFHHISLSLCVVSRVWVSSCLFPQLGNRGSLGVQRWGLTDVLRPYCAYMTNGGGGGLSFVPIIMKCSQHNWDFVAAHRLWSTALIHVGTS